MQLTRKPNAEAEYGRILRWYAAELGYQRVVWFAGKDAVRNARARLIERERLDDFVQVQPRPPGTTVSRWEPERASSRCLRSFRSFR